MMRLVMILAYVGLLTACASRETVATYNTTGPSGALVSQQVGFDANICRYDTGLTIYVLGNCPPSVRTNVYTR
jgi:hypothetical protein